MNCPNEEVNCTKPSLHLVFPEKMSSWLVIFELVCYLLKENLNLKLF